jgi:hypothetical protein
MKHEFCPTCGQKTTYELTLDTGTAKMMTAISDYIRKKGINVFSNTKEMIGNGYDFNAAGNITRPRAHGLIARIPGKATNYCITDKGFRFLKGEPIESVVIMKKASKGEPSHAIGHEGPEIKISQLLSGWSEYWSANGYEIQNGVVVTRPTVKNPTLL